MLYKPPRLAWMNRGVPSDFANDASAAFLGAGVATAAAAGAAAARSPPSEAAGASETGESFVRCNL